MKPAPVFILDTNVLSEMMKPNPAPAVLDWVQLLPDAAVYTTSICQAEILRGIEVLPPGKRRDFLADAADELFNHEFSNRILAFDSDAAVAYARIYARRQQAGRPISEADAQIAAIASARKATLATRNTADFALCRIDLIDPWVL